MAEDLRAASIPCTVILDAAVGYVMEQVTMVMLGAEGVCENGGIINKVWELFLPLSKCMSSSIFTGNCM